MGWLATKGALLWIPFGHSPDADLLAQVENRLLRIQVKTSTMRTYTRDGHERWSVQVATNGGNQSWSGVAKRFDPKTVDYLFALVGDGRRWFIPAGTIEGQTNIALGGPKYSEFEVDTGDPIMHLVYGDPDDRSRIHEGRGSFGDGEPIRSVKSEPLAEWVRIPPPPSNGAQSAVAQAATKSVERHAGGRTRISRNHQVTIPVSPFQAAELTEGDRFYVRATGPGRIELTRIDDLAKQQIGLFPNAAASSLTQ